MASIGENIKRIRKWQGLTQAELASKAGMSTMSIRRYESGYREPTFETVELIARVLDVNLDELIGNRSLKSETGGFARVLSDYETSEFLIENGGVVLDLMPDELRIRLQKSLLRLNEAGKNEAVKRVEELAEIPRYQAKRAAEATDTPSEGKDTPEE